MDSTVLLLTSVLLLVGLFTGALKFMRLIGFVARGGRPSDGRSRQEDSLQSFDERLAERLRDLERGQRL